MICGSVATIHEAFLTFSFLDTVAFKLCMHACKTFSQAFICMLVAPYYMHILSYF